MPKANETQRRFRRMSDTLRSGELLTPHLEKALLLRNDKAWPSEYPIKIHNKERKWDGYFHPSSHCAAPAMQLYLEFHPDIRLRRPDLTVDDIMNFQVGSALHSMIQSLLIEMGFTTEDEVEVPFINTRRRCSGTVDVRNITLTNGKNMPLEFKTASYIPGEPHKSYVQQLQVYMDVGCGDEPVEEGLILYMGKTTPHRFKEFLVRRDETLLQEIYDKWSRVLEAIEFNDPRDLYCCNNTIVYGKPCPADNLCTKLGKRQ